MTQDWLFSADRNSPPRNINETCRIEIGGEGYLDWESRAVIIDQVLLIEVNLDNMLSIIVFLIFSRGNKEYWRRILEIATEFCLRFHEISRNFPKCVIITIIVTLVFSIKISSFITRFERNSYNKVIVIHNKVIREVVKFIFLRLGNKI